LQAGYLFLATDAAALASLREGLAVQHAAGVHEAREVTASEASNLNPHVDVSDVVGGTFCPLDGFIRPMNLVQGWTTDAIQRGVVFELGGGDAGLWREGARVGGVNVAGEKILSGHVVLCAGAWSGLLAQDGIEIPVRPERRQIAITEPCDLLPSDMPMTIDCGDGFHLRVRDGRVLLLRPGLPPTEDPYDTSFESSWIETVQTAAHRRVPALRTVQIDRELCVAGLYEMTPDRHALLGPVPEVPNLVLATGNSGHGVMHAPALGQLAAEIILDGKAHAIDARPLRPERFAEGEPNPVSGVL
jgi:sarcosine oxidase subunit beta